MPTHLLALLSGVADPRRAQGKMSSLGPVLLFAVLAMLAGAKSYRQIHSFIKLHGERLNAAFGLAWRRAPAYNSVRFILQGVDAGELERVFRAHGRELWRPSTWPGWLSRTRRPGRYRSRANQAAAFAKISRSWRS